MNMNVEKVFKALGDKSRLRIVNMLAAKSMCVCEITTVLKLSQSTVSGHLRVLKDAGLVEDEKDGLWVEYRLSRTNTFNAGILGLVSVELNSDPKMEEERTSALNADREILCKT